MLPMRFMDEHGDSFCDLYGRTDTSCVTVVRPAALRGNPRHGGRVVAPHDEPPNDCDKLRKHEVDHS